MQKWEYCCKYYYHEVTPYAARGGISPNDELMNQLGSEGWELVAVHMDEDKNDAFYAFFKRSVV